ncbi:porin family protein [Microbulbifer sp. OS29]|uniref:Porin family protein n=1 Tax=Microbulbifer okhotskensis TaxID=2926617 RepID=A0A9X2EJX3_9GAMM|nr:outer membrane beta-barrel protein [Microbulbifer okhotskensis]MCO1333604.1 porin family protein [Microbulbifer okhotskensis]
MRFKSKALAAAAALLCSAFVQAEGAYVGGVFGVMNVDDAGDSPLNAGVRAGYAWGSGWGIEAEFTDSVVEGEYDVYWYNLEYSLATQAVYATYRSEGDIYLKGRLGYLHEELEVDGWGEEYTDSGISAGIGAGFKLTDKAVFELDYTLIETDVDYWSGSVVFNF